MGAKITDYDIQALVDGQVDDMTYMSLVELINNDPTLYNRYLLYKKQKSLLKSWFKDN